MKNVRKLNFKQFEDLSNINLDNIFSMLKKYGRSEIDFDFLESLNLTKEQYEQLSYLIMKYMEESYIDGIDYGRDSYFFEEPIEY